MSIANDRPFRKVVDGVTSRIANGEYLERAKLPSQEELAREFDTSIATVNRVVLILKDRKLIYGHRGKALYVRAGARKRAAARLAEDEVDGGADE